MVVLLSASILTPGNEKKRLSFPRFSYAKEHIYDNRTFWAESDIKYEETNIFRFPLYCLYSNKLILIFYSVIKYVYIWTTAPPTQYKM